MGAQNRFQLLHERRLEIDTRDRLLFTAWICFLISAHIVQMTAALPRAVGAPHRFSTLRTVKETGEQRVHFAMPHSRWTIKFQVLLHSHPEGSFHDRRLFARIGYAFMADLTYI